MSKSSKMSTNTDFLSQEIILECLTFLAHKYQNTNIRLQSNIYEQEKISCSSELSMEIFYNLEDCLRPWTRKFI